jgi:hypothetical protein
MLTNYHPRPLQDQHQWSIAVYESKRGGRERGEEEEEEEEDEEEEERRRRRRRRKKREERGREVYEMIDNNKRMSLTVRLSLSSCIMSVLSLYTSSESWSSSATASSNAY